MNFFVDGFEDLHNDEEQLIRQEKSRDVVLADFNGEKQCARVADKGYEVTLENCTCRDFQLRQLPCKHMYRLASRLKLFVNKGERSRELIADFSSGYATDWAFVVRPCNFDALDIKRQMLLVDGEKRGKTSRKESVPTQGVNFNFTRGQIFYDNVAAYTEVWRDALKKLSVSLQIDSATNTTTFNEVVFDGSRYVRKPAPFYGFVTFSVYKPNAERTKVEQISSYTCRQNEFVNLLKTGSFADENGELITVLS